MLVDGSRHRLGRVSDDTSPRRLNDERVDVGVDRARDGGSVVDDSGDHCSGKVLLGGLAVKVVVLESEVLDEESAGSTVMLIYLATGSRLNKAQHEQ